jgi:glucosamine-phosphate N-acetyltransferase
MVTIRNLTLNDIDGLIDLLQQLWPGKIIIKDAVAKVIARGIGNGYQFYTCAVDGEKLVGYCSLTIKNNLWTEGNLGNVDELVVDSEYRNQGIGKLLMANIEALAREWDCSRLELESSFHRVQAHKLYEEIGFEKRAYLFSKLL